MPFPTALPACPIDGGRTSGASSSTADVDNSDDADASRMSTSSSTPFASSFGEPADLDGVAEEQNIDEYLTSEAAELAIPLEELRAWTSTAIPVRLVHRVRVLVPSQPVRRAAWIRGVVHSRDID